MIKFKDINYNRNSYFNESIEKFISRISFDNEEWKYYNNHILVSTKGRIIGLNIINKIYFIKGQYIKSNSSISAALTGKSKTCKNFIWKYDAIER